MQFPSQWTIMKLRGSGIKYLINLTGKYIECRDLAKKTAPYVKEEKMRSEIEGLHYEFHYVFRIYIW